MAKIEFSICLFTDELALETAQRLIKVTLPPNVSQSIELTSIRFGFPDFSWSIWAQLVYDRDVSLFGL